MCDVLHLLPIYFDNSAIRFAFVCVRESGNRNEGREKKQPKQNIIFKIVLPSMYLCGELCSNCRMHFSHKCILWHLVPMYCIIRCFFVVCCAVSPPRRQTQTHNVSCTSIYIEIILKHKFASDALIFWSSLYYRNHTICVYKMCDLYGLNAKMSPIRFLISFYFNSTQ